MLKAVLTVPCPSIGFANSPPGAHTVFRGSHTSILSFKRHCSSQACRSCLATLLWDANKATSHAQQEPCRRLVLHKCSKAPPFLSPRGGRSQKRGESQCPHRALLCTSLWPARDRQEGKHVRACMASEEINYHRKQGARGLGEPYHTPSTALHQQSSLKLPPLPPESSESGGQRCRAMGSCEYQWLLCLVHPLARCLLDHWPQEPTMEPRVAIGVHGTT